MLVVIFTVSDARYAIPCQRVVEVLPLVQLQAAPNAPAWISGTFAYRGVLTPVLDLCQLLGDYKCPPWLSSRIILADCMRSDGGRVRTGLLTARMTAARHVNVQPLSGGLFASESHLGEVVLEGGRPLQMLHPERIVIGAGGALTEPLLAAGG
jgi:chemotaxis-related protein WspB